MSYEYILAWVRSTIHGPNTACETKEDARVHGSKLNSCKDASICQDYCRKNYPCAGFAEYWPNYGRASQCWCNCYNNCDKIRCVAKFPCTISDCESGARLNCKKSGGDIKIFQWIRGKLD